MFHPSLAIPALGALLLLVAGPAASETLVLISAEEAAQPDAPVSRAPRFREDGPHIEMKTPEHDAAYQAPLTLEARFAPGENGEPVDMESLRVSYVKLIKIDVTDRLRDYVTEDGILVPEADVPTGKHTFEIYIEDVADNASYRRTTFRVGD